MTWGIVATIKADAPAILRFAAYHLEQGAHRIYIYLDAPCPDAQEALKNQPRTRVVRCDDGYWKRHNNKRPEKHQSRQTFNATRAYKRADDVDWLIHMDVDEFLIGESPVCALLDTLAPDVLCARARPMELLAGGDPQTGAAFKKFIPAGRTREKTVTALYPEFGQHLKGGFLSHIAGKIFIRTGLGDVKFRIHNAFLDGEMNPGQQELPQLHLAHFHAPDWDVWQKHYAYRFAQGSYRADLGPARARDQGGITVHELFELIEQEAGNDGLRHFFDEVCADSPALRARLAAHDLLYQARLDFDAAMAQHFPDFPNI